MSRHTADRPLDCAHETGDTAPAQLILPRGLAGCTIEFADLPTLANWRFADRRPSVVVDEDDATLTVDDRRRTPFGRGARRRITLAAERTWRIECRRGLADVMIDARRPALGALVLTGGVSGLALRLGTPARPVELRFASGAAGVELQRAPGVPLSVRLLGSHTDVRIDGRRYWGAGGRDPIEIGDPAKPGVAVTFEAAATRVTIGETPAIRS